VDFDASDIVSSCFAFRLLVYICILLLLLFYNAFVYQQVNVKEQGRLLRQNEFLVWQGKGKKCLRHVFLFEELILFSKARRFPDRKVSVGMFVVVL
jgi:hypothetical protein